MRETLIPRNRPDDNTLGATPGIEGREISENEERNLREQLELRLRFASAVSRAHKIAYTDALKYYTDMHLRLTGELPDATEASMTKWAKFVDMINAAESQDDVQEKVLGIYKTRINSAVDHRKDSYWPFRYDKPKGKAVSMHFGSMLMSEDQPTNEPGILSAERLPEIRAKLKAMFTEIKERYPNVEEVHGESWLYNREAYRRFFPASYTAHPLPRTGVFVGGGTWGQFRRKDGSVNKELRAEFLRNLEHLDPDNLDAAFPLKTLRVRGPIADFYKEYGIE
ncbi:MAG: hypothetical protein JO019_02870 [Candidatus Kaiserbacteria bacterium]|nr:hypothetical protein [Candidatus Kaiserbacteria bacterium]